ncbi:MAG: tripartite tricarboxylate transporter substrate binding protein [Hyphomicrobiales bacterium]|nr:tripartite tricarboxylate transporter substrate binding protein [Hyphomicrobiales bacterium]
MSHSITRRTAVLGAVAILSAGLSAAPVLAQDNYPSKPVNLVVPWAPGGSADILARTIGDPLSAALGQPVVIVNQPGAGGTTGSAMVARSAPDGYTLLVSNIGSQAIAPHVYGKQIPYDALKDFTPIAQLVQQPNVLLVGNAVKAKTVDEFVAWMKANPGTPYATPGVGNSPHLAGEYLKEVYGIDMTAVPYNSGGEVNNALASGQIEVAISNMPEAITAVRNGQARALAVSSKDRSELMPDIPTFTELGKPELVVISWQGVVGPAGMDTAIVDKLNAAVNKVLSDPEIRKRLLTNGAEPTGGTPADSAAFMKDQYDHFAKLVKLAHLEPKQK